MKFFLLIIKNLRRNNLRSLLTALAVMVLVAIFCMLVTVLTGLAEFTSEKSRDIKLIITDRYRFPSQFKTGDMDNLLRPGGPLGGIRGFHPEQFCYWHFVACTLDPDLKDKDQTFIVIATQPEKIAMLMDDLDGLDPRAPELVKHPPRSGLQNIGLVLGADRMKKLNKKVGDVFKVLSTSHHDNLRLGLPIEIEFEIVGELPRESRWSDSAFMSYDYLTRLLQGRNQFDGIINLAWLMVDDQESAAQVSRAIEQYYPNLKCETFASAVSRFLEPMKDMFWGIKWLLTPAIVMVMTLIVANAIGITVRERTREMAVLKVLGFGRWRILFLVLGEGLLVGLIGGLVGGGLTQVAVKWAGGIPMGEGRPFYVSGQAWWWGPAVGAFAALVGGILPAWQTCSLKVSQVFARVA